MSNEITIKRASELLEITKTELMDLCLKGLFLSHFREHQHYTKTDYLKYWFKTYGQFLKSKPGYKIRITQKLAR